MGRPSTHLLPIRLSGELKKGGSTNRKFFVTLSILIILLATATIYTRAQATTKQTTTFSRTELDEGTEKTITTDSGWQMIIHHNMTNNKVIIISLTSVENQSQVKFFFNNTNYSIFYYCNATGHVYNGTTPYYPYNGTTIKVFDSDEDKTLTFKGDSTVTIQNVYFDPDTIRGDSSDLIDIGAMVSITLESYTPPSAVIASISSVMKKNLNLTWTVNTDLGFARYEVFQSVTQGILGTSIVNITSKTTARLSVSGLSPGTMYYFTIRILEVEGFYADSAQISTTTAAPPSAVTVTATDIAENSLKLMWTQSNDAFFSRYEVFQSTTAGVPGTLIASIPGKATTSWAVSNLSPGITYYYTVRVVDSEGLTADSAQQNITTVMTPLWKQTWFIGTLTAVIIVVIVTLALRRKGKD